MELYLLSIALCEPLRLRVLVAEKKFSNFLFLGRKEYTPS